MTTRDFYSHIQECFNASTNTLERELAEYATFHLAQLDAADQARRAKAAAAQAEKEPLRGALLAAMTNEPLTATNLIAAAHLEETVKPTAIPALLRPLIEAGQVTKTEVSIKGKGKHRAYCRAAQ
jgi:hypothetical protein